MVSAEDAVNAINDVSGAHAGHRAAHAKGTLLSGSFTATPEGAAAAVDEDDQRLRVVALRLEQPDLVLALPDAALGNAAFALGTAAAGEQAGEEDHRQVSKSKHS